MKKIICLFVVFLISNAVNAAPSPNQWEYVSFTKTTDIGRNLTQFILAYPDGKKDVAEQGAALDGWKDKEIAEDKQDETDKLNKESKDKEDNKE